MAQPSVRPSAQLPHPSHHNLMRILKIDATSDEYDPGRADVLDVSLSRCTIPMIDLQHPN